MTRETQKKTYISIKTYPIYRTIEELEKKPFEEVEVITLLRPFIMLFTEPIIICMTVCTCLATLVLK